MSIATELSDLGFSEIEAKTYTNLVTFGFRTLGQIYTYIDSTSLEEIRGAVDQLKTKGLVKEVKSTNGEMSIFIPVSPKIALSADLSEKLSQKLAVVSDEVKSSWDTTKSKIDSELDDFIGNKDKTLNEFENDVKKVTEQQSATLKEEVTLSDSNLKTKGKELGNEIKQVIIAPLSKLSVDLKTADEKLQIQKTEQSESIKQLFDKFSADLENTRNEITGEIQEYVNEVAMNTNARTTAITQSLSEITDKQLTDIIEIDKSLNSSVDEISKTINKSANEAGENVTTDVHQNFVDLLESLKKTSKDSSKLILTTLADLIKVKDALKSESIDVAKTSLDKFSQSLIASIENIQGLLLSSIESTQSTALEGLKQILDAVTKNLNSTEKDLTKILETTNTKLKSDLDILNKKVNSDFTKIFEQIKSVNTEFKETLKQESGNTVNLVKENLNLLVNEVTKFLNDTRTDLESGLGDLISDVSTNLDKMVENTESKNNSLSSETQDNVTEISDEKLQSLEKYVKEFVSNTTEQKVQSVNTISTSVQNAIDQTLDKLTNYRETHEDIIARMNEQITDLNNDAESLQIEASAASKKLIDNSMKLIADVRENQLEEFKKSCSDAESRFNGASSKVQNTNLTKLKQFKSDFELNIVNIREQLPTDIERIFNDHQDQLGNLKREFEAFKEKTSQHLRELEVALESNTKGLFGKKDFVIQKLEEHKRVTNDFGRLSQSLDKFLGDALSDTETTQGEVLDSLSRTVQDELERVENLIDDQSNSYGSVLATFTTDILNYEETFKETLVSSSLEIVTKFEGTVSSELNKYFVSPVTEMISKAQYLATGVEGNSKENRILINQESSMEGISEAVNQLVELLNSFQSELIEVVDGEITSINSTIETLKDEFEDKIRKTADGISKVIGTHETELNTFVKQIANQSLESVNEIVDKVKAVLSTTVETKSKEIKEIVAKESSNLDEGLEEQSKLIDDSFEKFSEDLGMVKDEIIKLTGQTINSTQNTQDKNTKETVGSIVKAVQSAVKGIKKSTDSLTTNVSKPLATIKTDTNNLDKDFKASVEKEKAIVEKALSTNFNKSLTGFSKIDTEVKKIDSYSKELIVSVEKLREKLQTDFNKSIEKFRTSVMNKTKEIDKSHLKIYSTQVESMKSLTLNHQNLTTEQLNELLTSVNSSVQNTNETVSEFIQNEIEGLKSATNQPTKVIEDSVVKASESASTMLKGIYESLDKVNDEYIEIVDKGIEGNYVKFSEFIQKVYNEAISNLQSNYSTVNNDLDSLSSKLTTTLKELNSKNEGNVLQSIEQIPGIIEETLQATAKSIKLLKTIAETSEGIEPKIIETTYVDASKEAVEANLNGIISRTKSKLTIISPNIDWLNPKIWEEYSRTAVTIITDRKQHTSEDEKIVEFLRKSENNIQLREHDESRYRGGMNMVIVTRDAEEIMVARPLNSKEPYGIVTSDPLFVSEFGTLVTNFMAMPQWKA